MFIKIFKSKIFYLIIIIIFAFALAYKLHHRNTQSYPDVVNEGFESGNLNYWKKELPAPHSCQIVNHPVRTGKYAAKFEMRHGDKWHKNAARAELYEAYSAPFNKDMWYSFSTFIPESWPNRDVRCLIAQWHGVADKGEINASPPLGIEYHGNKFMIRICWNDKPKNTDNSKSTNHLTWLYSSDQYAKKGVWHDFVINVKWSWKEGYLNVWIDSNKVVSYKGPIGYNDKKGPVFKFGIYRNDIPETFVLYDDNYRRGFSRQDIGF